MKKYFVELIKTMQYHVEAESMDEAEKMAIEMNSDKEAEIQWALNPYEEITVEEE